MRLVPASAWKEIETDWKTVFAASGSQSFFMSAEWVGSWLETFGAELSARVLLLDDGAGPVGAAVLARRSLWFASIPVRRLIFQTAGEPDSDGVAVEHTSVLFRPDCANVVLTTLGAHIGSLAWDEFQLSGVSEKSLDDMLRSVPHWSAETEWRPTYVVDLAGLRGAAKSYESALSRNTREQLRRSLRLYRERGDPVLRFAETSEEALSFLSVLAELHQQRWKARGEPGAFASRRWRAFHERLISRAMPMGGIQLVRVSVGDETIGVLYNFVHSGVVSFYQSGLRYEDDNRLKPGLVTHALVIQACLDRGLDVYDFLAAGPGGSRYKASLATATERLAWTVLRRATVRVLAVALLRHIKRRARSSGGVEGEASTGG